MTALAFIAYSCLSLSPALSLFKQNIYQHPARLVIVVLGIFSYFVSLVITSIFYTIINSLFSSSASILWLFAFLNVLIQEIIRYLTFKLVISARPSFIYLKDEEKHSLDSVRKLSVAVGVGFCIGAAVFNSLNLLIYSSGPWVFGIDGETSPNLFLYSSLKTSAVSILNFLWTVMLFKSLESTVPRVEGVDRTVSGDGGSNVVPIRNNSGSGLSRTNSIWVIIIVGSHFLNTAVSLLQGVFRGTRNIIFLNLA